MTLEIIGMFLCFAGVVMVAFAPGKSSVSTESSQLIWGLSICLVMAWSHAFVSMLNRMMSDVPWYVIMFWHSAIGLCSASIMVTAIAIYSGNNKILNYTNT